jgi:hypothetical protein
MDIKRIRMVAGLAFASFALAACTTTSTPTTTVTTTTPPTPGEQLTAALDKLKGASYNLTIQGGGGQFTGTGSVDAIAHAAAGQEHGDTQGVSITLASIEIADKLWVKMDFGSYNSQLGLDPTKWMLIDESKLTGKKTKMFDLAGPDALDLHGMFTSVSGLKNDNPTQLSGTVDLTKATGVTTPSSDDLTKAGAAASAVPFTVKLDDQGRLVDVKLSPTADQDTLASEIGFSSYGAPTTIAAPPATDVINAPASVYETLNS